jgi:hypothetical protein
MKKLSIFFAVLTLITMGQCKKEQPVIEVVEPVSHLTELGKVEITVNGEKKELDGIFSVTNNEWGIGCEWSSRPNLEEGFVLRIIDAKEKTYPLQGGSIINQHPDSASIRIYFTADHDQFLGYASCFSNRSGEFVEIIEINEAEKTIEGRFETTLFEYDEGDLTFWGLPGEYKVSGVFYLKEIE